LVKNSLRIGYWLEDLIGGKLNQGRPNPQKNPGIKEGRKEEGGLTGIKKARRSRGLKLGRKPKRRNLIRHQELAKRVSWVNPQTTNLR